MPSEPADLSTESTAVHNEKFDRWDAASRAGRRARALGTRARAVPVLRRRAEGGVWRPRARIPAAGAAIFVVAAAGAAR
jgi:hypothetical protein